MKTAAQLPVFSRHYGTPPERFHVLPPGIAADRRRPADANEVRAGLRAEFDLADDVLLLVQIGSGFKTKGLDRSLLALASLPEAVRHRTQLIVMGQDDPALGRLEIEGDDEHGDAGARHQVADDGRRGHIIFRAEFRKIRLELIDIIIAARAVD